MGGCMHMLCMQPGWQQQSPFSLRARARARTHAHTHAHTFSGEVPVRRKPSTGCSAWSSSTATSSRICNSHRAMARHPQRIHVAVAGKWQGRGTALTLQLRRSCRAATQHRQSRQGIEHRTFELTACTEPCRHSHMSTNAPPNIKHHAQCDCGRHRGKGIAGAEPHLARKLATWCLLHRNPLSPATAQPLCPSLAPHLQPCKQRVHCLQRLGLTLHERGVRTA